ncbi:3-dehydroquinate synthase [uncultured archaeon]|nr:3-dehydroquinate synthase [uncultured archaeon]
MKEITLEAGTGVCRIIANEKFGNLAKYCGEGKVVLVADANAAKLHGGKLAESGAEIIEISPSEAAKSMETAMGLFRKFLGLELDRSAIIVGVGGGIVCDIAGFAAATYLRGLGVGFVPTTLLAMVDASIGGKNGVNLGGYKNLIGTTRQPGFVLIDFDFLETLPESELGNGLAEMIKHAAISGGEKFDYLEKNIGALISPAKASPAMLEKLISDSIEVKTSIVGKDELEGGERMKLNFGHTVGHALEKAAGIPHGNGVSIGMAVALKISVSRGLLNEPDACRIINLLEKAGLPAKANFDKALVFDAIRKDKKRRNGACRMVLLNGIGKPVIEKIELGEIETALEDIEKQDYIKPRKSFSIKRGLIDSKR